VHRSRRGVPPLLLFVVASLGLHATVFRAVVRGPISPEQHFEPSADALTGDTLDVEPAPVETSEEEVTAPAETATAAAPSAPSGGPAPASNRLSASAASPGAVAQPIAAHAPLFGAVGVRFASDLATTFTRAFPQAASADPVWASAPLGVASSAEVTLVLDEDGHLERSTVTGSPSAALRHGIDRTMALLGTGRAFTAHGAVTRIRITSRVTRDDVHDGLHGDVFALSGGSFSGDVGNAFFALPPTSGPGRRIDVELRLLP
jgi:hypothetical protein